MCILAISINSTIIPIYKAIVDLSTSISPTDKGITGTAEVCFWQYILIRKENRNKDNLGIKIKIIN